MKLFNSNKKEILLKSINVLILKFLGYCCGLLFLWFVANKYGSRIQGIFSIAFMFLSICAMISKLGISAALVKWIANAKTKGIEKYIVLKSLSLVLISSILIGFILFVLSQTISLMYDKPNIEKSLKYAALTVPLYALLEVASSYFRGKKLISVFGTYFHFLKFLLPLLFLSGFYFTNISTDDAPILSYLMGIFLVIIILFVNLFLRFKDSKSELIEGFTNKFIVAESYPMLVSASIVLIMGWSDVFILGFFVTEDVIGVYSTAIKLATIVAFIYNAVATIAAPKIAKFFQSKNFFELKETITFSSNLMLLTGLPIFILLFSWPSFFLGLFGEEYIAGKNVLRILLFAQLVNVLTGPIGVIYNMTNQQKKLQKFIIIALVFNIVLSLLLVREFGLIGVAFASAGGMILWNVMGSVYLFRKMKIKTFASIKF